MYMAVELVVGIGMGFIPYVDNFGEPIVRSYCRNCSVYLPAHLGGFLMGLLVGTTFYPVISTTKRHKSIIWAFRLAALPLVIILFVVLIHNFYTSDPYAGELVSLLIRCAVAHAH